MNSVFAYLDWEIPEVLGAIGAGVGVSERMEMVYRLGLAAILGALIGAERSRSEKPADTRTMMLISVGAAAFALVGERVIAGSEGGAPDGIVSDPTRVLAYIISGVGFLGAGAILHSKRTVKGLTTASSIWCTAAVGAACGLGEILIAGVVSGIVLVTLWGPWVYYGVSGKEPPGGFGNGNGHGNGNSGTK